MPKPIKPKPSPAYAQSKKYFRLLDRRVAAGRRYAELASHQLPRSEAAADRVAHLEAMLCATGLYGKEDREAVARAEAARAHVPGTTSPDDALEEPCRLCSGSGPARERKSA